MEEAYNNQQFSPDPTIFIRDLEEKQRLLKEQVLLIGKSLIEEKEKNRREIQELKKSLFTAKEENTRIKEILERVTEQLTNTTRKEELSILQRQFDLFREK